MDHITGSMLRAGDVVQISPEHSGNPAFAGCMLTVSEIKDWGVQGYVQSLGTREGMGGQAYYRVKFTDIEFVGKAVWAAGSAAREGDDSE